MYTCTFTRSKALLIARHLPQHLPALEERTGQQHYRRRGGVKRWGERLGGLTLWGGKPTKKRAQMDLQEEEETDAGMEKRGTFFGGGGGVTLFRGGQMEW
jgi:hypothetical protein